ncbi:MAG: DUF2330 domain-containing protein [Candidatus Thermoplasmatota archaeon]|nr:DUF2330 domain-containing protein [Candidatus Thermoplasmatota archaeon]
MMKKIILVLIPLMMIFSCFSQIVIADGGVIGYHYQTIYHPENSQSAIINYKNGVQKMLISVNFTWSESDKSAWILPVPSKPEDTDVDVIDGTPTFSGYDVKEDAKEEISKDLAFSLLGYLMPWPLGYTALYVYTEGMGALSAGGLGVQVYKHIEKEGITVEVVSATEGEGLYNYLTNKGLNVSEGVIPPLDSYVSKNYTFIISWVSSSDKTMREPGIVIEFPTNKIYYPLILTSIYGSDVIPIDVIVMAHVTPDVYSEIKKYTKVTYWKGDVSSYYSYYPSDLKNFTYNISKGWDGRFTRIEISAPSNAFKQDLWIENKKPWNVEYAESTHEAFDENFLLILLLLFLLLSFITSLICGGLFISRKKEKIPFYLLIGLCNMGFGWVGMIISTYLLRKRLAAPAGGLAAFVVLYVLLFILLVFVSFGIIFLPLIF